MIIKSQEGIDNSEIFLALITPNYYNDIEALECFLYAKNKIVEINFYFRKQPYGWLSNFWRAKQEVDGKMYDTNEHFYQAQKANKKVIREWIAAAPTPYLAMMAGRSLREGKELRDDWDGFKKIGTMAKGLKAKFSQNKNLKRKLLSTGNAILHEDSPDDMFWGKKGSNWLGILLMGIRDELKIYNKITKEV